MNTHRIDFDYNEDPSDHASNIAGQIVKWWYYFKCNDETKLANWIWEAFPWAECSDEFPDLSADEIVSMAACGFEVN